MKESVLELFGQYPQLAIVISLLLSIVIAVAGLLPSVFITAANILFFGFWNGLIISFIGEALGAIIAFALYRRGFKKKTGALLHRYQKVQRLVNAQGKEAFLLIFSLRLLPFVPSGLVTFAAAIGNLSAVTFLISSSLGKLPALFIEAYAVNEVTRFGWQGKAILVLIAAAILYYTITQLKKAAKKNSHR